MKICDDCFEEIKDCVCKPEITIEQCSRAWQTIQTRGFKSQDEIDQYQIIKKTYKKLRGKDLPKVVEKVGKK